MFTTNQLILEPTYAQKCFAENIKLRTESKMVYSTPYVGNYVCIILVMLEEFVLDGSFIGWSLITVRDSCTYRLWPHCVDRRGHNINCYVVAE